jgi:hypothetical protein
MGRRGERKRGAACFGFGFAFPTLELIRPSIAISSGAPSPGLSATLSHKGRGQEPRTKNQTYLKTTPVIQSVPGYLHRMLFP